MQNNIDISKKVKLTLTKVEFGHEEKDEFVIYDYNDIAGKINDALGIIELYGEKGVDKSTLNVPVNLLLVEGVRKDKFVEVSLFKYIKAEIEPFGKEGEVITFNLR